MKNANCEQIMERKRLLVEEINFAKILPPQYTYKVDRVVKCIFGKEE